MEIHAGVKPSCAPSAQICPTSRTTLNNTPGHTHGEIVKQKTKKQTVKIEATKWDKLEQNI